MIKIFTNTHHFNNFFGREYPKPPSKAHGATCKFVNLEKKLTPRLPPTPQPNLIYLGALEKKRQTSKLPRYA